MPRQQGSRAAGPMQCLQIMRRDLGQVVKINRNRATLGELKMINENKLSSAILDMYDIRTQARQTNFDTKPKDNDGTIFTLGDCIDDVITFLESLEKE